MMMDASETWAAGASYEPYIGRWSRLVARAFVQWVGVRRNSRWLDVGCGTGALTGTIVEDASPSAVCSIDRSEGYVAFARSEMSVACEFCVADACVLPVASNSMDAVVSGLVLNFVPEPQLVVNEMRRVVRPGGIVALYVWDYAGEMQLIRHFWDAARSLDPRAELLDEGARFPICEPSALEGLLQQAGLEAVESRAFDVPTHFRDFEDYWTPFLGGQGPAPGYAMSLSDEDRVRLQETLRSRLPISADGSIDLIARAWAVRGRRRTNF